MINIQPNIVNSDSLVPSLRRAFSNIDILTENSAQININNTNNDGGFITWTYADQTARLAATGFVNGDVYKVAYQVSDGTFWVLIDNDPITWLQLATGGVGTGTEHQTLRHNGTGWVANSLLLNTSSEIKISNTTIPSGNFSSLQSNYYNSSDKSVLYLRGDGIASSVAKLVVEEGSSYYTAGITSAAYFSTNVANGNAIYAQSSTGNTMRLVAAKTGKFGLVIDVDNVVGQAADMIVGYNHSNEYFKVDNLGFIRSDPLNSAYLAGATHLIGADDTGVIKNFGLSGGLSIDSNNLVSNVTATATNNYILRGNGTSWVESSVLQNDGTNISITNNLTVDTNVLYVDSVNNRVGINMTPAANAAFDVTGAIRTTVGLISPYIKPASDSTTAVQIYKADGTTAFVTFDTSNQRVGINNAAPSYRFDVVGNIRTSVANITPSITAYADSTTGILIKSLSGTTIAIFDTTNGYFGIGTTPTSKLHIVGTYAGNTGLSNVNSVHTINSGTGSSSYYPAAFNNTIDYTGTDAALSWVSAMNNTAKNSSASYAISQVFALNNYIYCNGLGGITTAYGSYNHVNSVTGSTITNYFGYYQSGTNDGVGTITNFYGLYIAAVTGGATLNYAIYSNGGQSYHLGNLGIGIAITSSVARLKLGAGSASICPLQFASGAVMSSAAAGAFEFLTDDLYFTITTGTARKRIVMEGYVAKTADYTATSADRTIDVTANNVTITLPTAVGLSGRRYTIKNTGTGNVTVATTSSQTIDGSTTYSLAVQYSKVTVESNNANWIIVF